MRNLLLTLGLAVLFQGCAAHGHLNCPQAAADSFTLVSDVDDTGHKIGDLTQARFFNAPELVGFFLAKQTFLHLID